MLGEKMRKKGVNIAITFLIVAAIALAVLVIALVFLGRGRGLGEEVVKLAPAQDDTCLQKTKLQIALGKTPKDDDKDGRDDSCDWCVCSRKECHNDNGDTDGDKLPVACDEDDSLGKGLTKKGFETKEKCVKDKTLFKVGTAWICYPDLKTTN